MEFKQKELALFLFYIMYFSLLSPNINVFVEMILGNIPKRNWGPRERAKWFRTLVSLTDSRFNS